MKNVLIVDDDEHSLRLIDAILRGEGYLTATAKSGPEALERAARSPPDLVLLDVMMPQMDGFEVARRLKAVAACRHVPIIMVTALDDRASRLAALDAGAEEFVSKPIDRAELTVRVRNLLRLKEFNDLLADNNKLLEAQVAERTRDLLLSHRETIATLTRASAYKDEETGTHVSRISYYTVELAATLGMDATFRDTIHYASPMHDVGKIAIPDQVLQKPGRLDAAEWDVMKSHARMGAQLLAGSRSPYLVMGAGIALGHHERWCGGGYPQGLTGEQNPLPARIMQICDVYDALRSRRPYKEPFDHARAVEIIRQGDGRTMPDHFDPAVLDAFMQGADRFSQIWEAHSDAQ